MKKFLSIILAMAMIISLVPAVFAEGTTNSHVENYSFSNNGEKGFLIMKINQHLMGTYFEYVIDGTSYYIGEEFHKSYGERKWKWFATNDAIIAKVAPNSGYFNVNASNYLQINLGAGGAPNPALAFALAFEAPTAKAAFYYPTLYVNASGYKPYDYNFYLRKLNNSKTNVNDIAYYTDNSYVHTSDARSSDNGYKAKNAIYTTSGDEFVLGITGNTGDHRFVNLTLTEVQNPAITLKETSYAFDVTDGDTSNDTATVLASVSGNTVLSGTSTSVTFDVAREFLTYKTGDPSIATVSVDGTLTAVGGGTTTVWAETADGTYASAPATVTVTAPVPEPEEDPNLKAAFDAVPVAKNDYVAPTVVGLGFDGTVMKAEDNRNGTFTLTAEETKDEGEKFLYWAVGNTDKKRIISFNNVITNYVPAGEGRNYLIAVYEGDIASDKNEYYNQNGQLIAKQTSAPDYPAMAGYGTAKSWEQYGDTNIYVAQYDKTEDDRDEVTVTVIDGNGGGTVPFGGSVTCTATGENFKCWKKTNINGDEIVSVDATYTFKAWENCTVTAVYEVHTPLSTAMKIIIDDFAVGSETGVMAEFIGLDDAVEKGIMFTDSETEKTTKIAMSTKDNQFTVIADEEGKYVGYAILKSGSTYQLITDGSYTK